MAKTRVDLTGGRIKAGWPTDLAVYMRTDHGATRNARALYGEECRRQHATAPALPSEPA